MKRSIFKKICIVSGVVLVLLVSWMAVSVARSCADVGESIIGGADGPTAVFFMETHPARLWILPVLAVFAGTGIVLLIKKDKK